MRGSSGEAWHSRRILVASVALLTMAASSPEIAAAPLGSQAIGTAAYSWGPPPPVSFAGGPDVQSAYGIVRLGDLYVAGYSSAVLGRANLTIWRFSDAGAVLATTFWGAGGEYGTGIASDGANLFLSGISHSGGAYAGTTLGPNGNGDAVIAAFAPDGTLLWDRQYDGGGHDWGYGVSATSDAVYLVGTTENLSKTDDWDVLVSRYSPEGELLWKRTWNATSRDTATAVLARPDAVYVTGTVYNHTDLASRGFLLSYSEAGELLWERQWSSGTRATSWTMTHAGSLIWVAGSRLSLVSPTTPRAQAVIRAYTPSGDLALESVHAAGDYDVALGLSSLDSSVYLALWTSGLTRSDMDVGVLRLDGNGTVLSEVIWGGGRDEEPHAILADGDTIYTVGRTNSNGDAFGDAFLIRQPRELRHSLVGVTEAIVAGDTASVLAAGGNLSSRGALAWMAGVLVPP